MISKKICLVGDFAVGKTSMISCFVEQQFSDQYLSTVGVKISRKLVEVEKQTVQLLIWDIEGKTKFKAIAPTYLQGAKGAIIVADVCREETVAHLQEHCSLFFSINPKGLIVIALNKADLLNKGKQIQTPILTQQEQVLGTYATSAKTGENVNVIFQNLTTNLISLL